MQKNGPCESWITQYQWLSNNFWHAHLQEPKQFMPTPPHKLSKSSVTVLFSIFQKGWECLELYQSISTWKVPRNLGTSLIGRVITSFYFSHQPLGYLKEHSVVFGKENLCLNKLNKQTLPFLGWINKLTLKGNTISYCFTLCIFGGPCHLSSFKVLWGPYFPLRTACLFSYKARR